VAGGGFVYANPYFVNPALTAENPYTEVTPAGLDYSRSLAIPTAAQEEDTPESVVGPAMAALDRARAHFRKGRYEEATVEVERALKLLPGDRSMQEFRALTLFARGRYTEAAAVIYAVLAAGPGWNEDTLALLYPNEGAYPKQLRALQGYVGEHPREGGAHFLLAYHHLVAEKFDDALAELRLAAKFSPNDKLSAELIDALTRPPEDQERDKD
jgi:tetratricopeptide (TPR) repeat protein